MPANKKEGGSKEAVINAYGVVVKKGRGISLVKEASYPCEDNKISSPESTAKMLDEVFKLGDRADEQFYIIALNTKSRIIGTFLVSQGDLVNTIIHPREIFKRAFLCNAAAVIFAHNHPSGDPTPSCEDIAITRRLVNAGELLGITVRDHIICSAEGKYSSFREEKLISYNFAS